MSYVFPPSAIPALPIKGSDALFPLRRIFCVGRNYAAHIKELGGDPKKEPPVFFTKPIDALVPLGGTVPYPPQTVNLHHEVELVIALGQGGANIPAEKAQACIFGYAVGIDLTRRDLQEQFRQKGQPWDMAKAFDFSAPCSAIVPVSQSGHPSQGRIALKVNGQTKQDGNLGDMILNAGEIIAALSGFVALAAGDLIFTGTPEGVGPLVKGDKVEALVEGIGEVGIRII